MTLAFPFQGASFRPQTGGELRKLRSELIDGLRPRTVDDLVFFRSIGVIDVGDEAILETIEALNFVIGDGE